MSKKGILVLAFVTAIVLTLVAPADSDRQSKASFLLSSSGAMNTFDVADVSGTGSTLTSTLFADRTVTGLQLRVLNHYVNTSLHIGNVSLVAYQVPGWILYRVGFRVRNLTASPERAIAGITETPSDDFSIKEYPDASGYYYNQVTQGFFKKGFDARLNNYSVFYYTNTYGNPLSTYGHIYLGVRDGYLSGSNATTSEVDMAAQALKTWLTVNTSADLNANKEYFVVMNGTTLTKKASKYPAMYWQSQITGAGYSTERYYTFDSLWGSIPYEAFLNYTYTPWNRTTSSALLYKRAENTAMAANGTALTGKNWNITSSKSIVQIRVTSNQSVYMDYNMTLWYKKDIASNMVWRCANPGGTVMWNATVTASYAPIFSSNRKFLNVSKMSDWSIVGLYNGTSTSDYGHYASYSKVAYCTSMTNGTWKLRCIAFNYLTLIATKDSGSGQPLPTTASILANVSIEPSVQDQTNNPAVTGTTNLTIWHSASRIWAPPNATVTAGKSSYTWDISTTTSQNGRHTIEIFWSNGTEAGYLSKDLAVYYPTSLIADDYTIDAISDESFFVRVNYVNTYNSQGLNSTYATVRCSFNNEANVSMSDGHSNGTWTNITSTLGIAAGTYQFKVYAEGYALQNQTITITVSIFAKTSISISWQPSNTTITYAQSFNLTVDYTYGGIDVPPSAIVNVTVSGHTHNLTYYAGAWHVSIPGKDVGLGNHSATIQAWSYGYEYQTMLTLGLNVTVASDSLISVTTGQTYGFGVYSSSVLYNDGWVVVSVRVQDMGSNPITLGSVNLTIEAHTYTFTPQPSDNYTVTLQARYFGVGLHSGTIHVYADGYQEKTTPLSLVVAPVPAHIIVSQGQVPSVMYLNQSCVFVLEYVDNHTGNAIPGANVADFIWPNVITEMISPGRYRVNISSFMLSLDSHLFNVTLGHVNFTTGKFVSPIMIRPVHTHFTTLTSFSQYENETALIWVNLTDVDHGKFVLWASVNATVQGIVYPMTYSSHGVYSVSFRITLPPSSVPYIVTINAAAVGCEANTTSTGLAVLAKEYSYITLDFVGSPVEGNSITLRAIVKHSNTDAPIVGALVEFEVAAVYVNGTRQNFIQAYLTSSSGEASWAFNIPVGTLSAVDYLEVSARYHGATSVWAANKTLQIKVTLGMVAIMFLFLTSPEGLVAMTFVFGAVVAAAYNQKKRKPKKIAAKRSLEHQLQDFRDLGTLRHFMAVYVNRGTCVFYHPFTESRIQADLISGFISAITSVYGEIKGNGVQGTLEEIHYHGLRLNSYSGKYVIGILILEGELTPLLKDRLQYFVERFEAQYQDNLRDWNGETECFDPEWIVSNLVAAFNFNWLLPHKLSTQKKMSGDQKKILRILGTRIDEKGEFLIGDVLSPIAEATGRTEPEAFDYLLNMEENGLMVPISISTVLQRQGMALVDKEACAAGEEPVSPGVVVVVQAKTEEKPGPRGSSARIETKPARTSGKAQTNLADEAPTEEKLNRVLKRHRNISNSSRKNGSWLRLRSS